MELTRTVLIEKEKLFARYFHPNHAPEHLWKQVYLKLKTKNFDNIAEYIAKEIFSVMIGSSQYTISDECIFHYGFIDITSIYFENLYKFEFRLSLIIEILNRPQTNDEFEFCELQRYISLIWRNKHRIQ